MFLYILYDLSHDFSLGKHVELKQADLDLLVGEKIQIDS